MLDSYKSKHLFLSDRIEDAVQYVRKYASSIGNGNGPVNANELKNDAANIYANSYDEYNAIWRVLEGVAV